MLENFLYFLFPSKCLNCETSGKIICESCFDKIPTNIKDKLNILSIYEYRNKTINELLWQLKYHHNSDVAKSFAEKVSLEIKNWLKDFPENIEIIFIPAPLNQSDKRLNNHAEAIAKSISKYFPCSKVIDNLLIKKNKKKQAHTKNKHERIQNVSKAFSVSPVYLNNKQEIQKEFQNKVIIIVDDVTTTGATISNIRYILADFLNIREENILGVTIAH